MQMDTTHTERPDRANLFGVFACGALTGAALVLLFAPARGRDTRERIASTAREGRDRAARLIDRNRQATKQQKARAEAIIDRASTQVGEFKADVVGAIQDARSAFDAARNEERRR